MNKSYYVLIIGLLLCCTSCATLKVKTSTPYQNRSIEKIALVGTYIGRVKQPKFPLIDASAFNKRTNKISDEIMDHQAELVHEIEKLVQTELTKRIKQKVLTQDDFTESGLAKLNDKYKFDSMIFIEHDHYPKLLSTSKVNWFPFENGEVLEYFNNFSNPSISQDICKFLEVDAFAISYTRLNVISAGMFGMNGNLRLDTHLYIFDQSGNVIGKSEAYTKPMAKKGKKFADYKLVFDQYPVIVSLLNQDIIKSKPRK